MSVDDYRNGYDMPNRTGNWRPLSCAASDRPLLPFAFTPSRVRKNI
jgi:hypothetical protein